MVREILIISADRRFYQQIEGVCRNSCDERFSFTFAQNTVEAANHFRLHSVALAVMGHLSKEESTIALLFYIWHSFPDIPIYSITGDQEFPESLMIEEDGIVLQSSKKLLPIKKWPEIITNALDREREGGFLFVNDVSNFAQMIENEVRTCTLRIVDHTNSRLGILFFEKGELKNARLKTVQGQIAAYAILSWENVKIYVQDSCNISSSKIQSNLQAVLIESHVKKDHQDKPYSSSEAWINAAEEEKQNYQKLVSQVAAPPKAGNNDVTSEMITAPVSKGSKAWSLTKKAAMTAIILLLFIAAAYLIYGYLKRPAIEHPLAPTPSTSQPVPPATKVAPPDDSALKLNQMKSSTISKPGELPSGKDPLTVETNEKTSSHDPVEPANKVVSPVDSIVAPIQSKERASQTPPLAQPPSSQSPKGPEEPVSSPDSVQPQKKIDLAEDSGPESNQSEADVSRKPLEPSDPQSQLNNKHVEGEALANKEQIKPETVSQVPLFSVYLHYTYGDNRALAHQLADHLTANNVVVPKIEHARFNKNDIRFFHTADQSLAMDLQARVIEFFKENYPHKNDVKFRMKNLAGLYPQVPRGQLEIWLNLPGK